MLALLVWAAFAAEPMKVKLTVWSPVDGPGQPVEHVYEAEANPEFKIPLNKSAFTCRAVVYPVDREALRTAYFSKILCDSKKLKLQVSSEGMCSRKPKNEVMRAAMTHTHEKLTLRENGGKDQTIWLECDPGLAVSAAGPAVETKKIPTH